MIFACRFSKKKKCFISISFKRHFFHVLVSQDQFFFAAVALDEKTHGNNNNNNNNNDTSGVCWIPFLVA